MALIKGNPKAVEAYREHKAAARAKVAPAKKAETRKKVAVNQAATE